MQVEVDKAAKLLALAETPIKIASQVQDHARSLACPPARWHPRPPAGMPDCSYARSPVQCRAVLCDAVPYRADACACGGVRARCVVWVVSCGVVQCWCGVGASVPVPVPVPVLVRGSPCSYARRLTSPAGST